MIDIKRFISNLLGEGESSNDGSIAISDKQIIEQFVADQANTFLVSFPRTGSHWLRMIMELYFERPSLVRVFYFSENTDYLTLHTHDMDLNVERENVIYLYRDPVETIYSQLNYYNEDISNRDRTVYWSDIYGRHLDKWLHQDSFSRHKTIVTYEGMKKDIVTEFGKITSHFGAPLDADKLMKATARITKEEVKKKTTHDPQVVKIEKGYDDVRNHFREQNGELVWQTVLTGRQHLVDFFNKA